MAVLQRTPMLIAELDLRHLREIYPFEKFDRQLTDLVRLLAPGGLLAVRFSQYLVSEATAADDLGPLASAPLIEPTAPMFDRNSQRIEHPQAYCSIHVKKQSRSA